MVQLIEIAMKLRDHLQHLIFAALSFITFTQQTFACDLCSIYNSVLSQNPQENTWRLSVAEQFTSFEDLQLDGHRVENEFNQHLHSSITQYVAEYSFSTDFAAQLSLPYINRRFRRIEEGESRSGVESGIGDMTLIAKYIPYLYKDDRSTFLVQAFAGLKLPTGETDRLREEQEEHEEDGEHEEHDDHERFVLRHGGEHHEEGLSAIHGHDLALGSGSFDFPLGLSFFAQHERIIFSANVQYSLRTEGDHDYEYADDLIYSAGPAYYLFATHPHTLAAGATLSGEHKPNDRSSNGEIHDDTAIDSLFLGPVLTYTFKDNLSGELGLDLPLDIDNSSLQAVPSYRIHAGLSVRL